MKRQLVGDFGLVGDVGIEKKFLRGFEDGKMVGVDTKGEKGWLVVVCCKKV